MVYLLNDCIECWRACVIACRMWKCTLFSIFSPALSPGEYRTPYLFSIPAIIHWGGKRPSDSTLRQTIRKAFCLCLWWKFTGLHLICVMLYWSIYNKKAWRENRQKPLVSLRNLGRSQLGSRSVKYTKNKPKIIPGFANSALFVVVMENTTNPSPNCFTNYVKKNFFSES